MLIVWGGHVNSTNSGMAFPDWPTSNAAPMMTYAPSQWLWEGDKFWEHGHRLFASLVGLVTTALVVVAYRETPKALRPNKLLVVGVGAVFVTIAAALSGFNSMPAGFMEGFMAFMALGAGYFYFRSSRSLASERLLWLSMAAFAMVVLQGAFGGYTVRNNLPDWTSTTHGMLAEIFFLTVIGITFLASIKPSTQTGSSAVPSRVRAVVMLTWGVTFVQFFLGALTRHTDAWAVSASFPHWSPAGFFPDVESFQYAQVVIHFVHRTLAYVVVAAIVVQWVMIRKSASGQQFLSRVTLGSVILVVSQVFLGAAILWTARGEVVTTLHVMTGVALLAVNTMVMFLTAGSSSITSTTPADPLHVSSRGVA